MQIISAQNSWECVRGTTITFRFQEGWENLRKAEKLGGEAGIWNKKVLYNLAPVSNVEDTQKIELLPMLEDSI